MAPPRPPDMSTGLRSYGKEAEEERTSQRIWSVNTVSSFEGTLVV